HCTSPAEARLHLVRNEHDAVLVTYCAQTGNQLWWGDMEPTFSLYRLDDERRYARRIDIRLEEEGKGFERLFNCHPELRAREWNMVDLRLRRAQPLLVREKFSKEGHRHRRAAVKCPRESNHAGPPGCRASNLDRVLGRLGARGEQSRLGCPRHWRERVQPLGQFDVAVIERDLEASMGEPLQLLAHGRQDLRMAM